MDWTSFSADRSASLREFGVSTRDSLGVCVSWRLRQAQAAAQPGTCSDRDRLRERVQASGITVSPTGAPEVALFQRDCGSIVPKKTQTGANETADGHCGWDEHIL